MTKKIKLLTKGVDKYLQTLARLASDYKFLLVKSRQQLVIMGGRINKRVKTLARLASGLLFLLAKPIFYMH
jgi:hypothetical protein